MEQGSTFLPTNKILARNQDKLLEPYKAFLLLQLKNFGFWGVIFWREIITRSFFYIKPDLITYLVNCALEVICIFRKIFARCPLIVLTLKQSSSAISETV